MGRKETAIKHTAELLKVWCCVFLDLRKFMSLLPAQLITPVSLRR
ncbi:hypothetical protein Pla52n_29980 [Stieleria varia]|uniref:Uncharacterized protein n=1 Tax=Stieleria varia TaxID=2528005 RepID=A0A5C6AYB2_9BACT|nr:hypothetical protein Pla52n_29980 [Stieleria varia]